MAAPLSFARAISNKILQFSKTYSGRNVLPCVVCEVTRGKKTKSGGSTRNQKTKTAGKHRRPWKKDGEFVYKGDVIHTQYGLQYYPGENVGIQRNNTLFALTDGILCISSEKLQPYPDSPLYQRVKDGLNIYKNFYNIFPTPVHAKFKLVSETSNVKDLESGGQ
ncbi:50S ribosomal protein L27-like [Mya arenaria]|uniref:50S ribosomal protein L27-like n=1 Tax=Mya arenaria TaxID=6604 RepID=UPI0022E57EB1|nr:50S ribosomal protein L27-like [Mya arenaria]